MLIRWRRILKIVEASNGKVALAALQAYRSSLSALLPDIVMPAPDGFGILEEMNRLHWIDALPTIIIFAETGGAYIDHAFALGASAYISRAASSRVSSGAGS